MVELAIFKRKFCEVQSVNGRFFRGKVLEVWKDGVLIDDIKQGYTVLYNPEEINIMGRIKILDMLNRHRGWEAELKKQLDEKEVKQVDKRLGYAS